MNEVLWDARGRGRGRGRRDPGREGGGVGGKENS